MVYTTPRSTTRSLLNIARLIRIAAVLARHDALFFLGKLGIAPGAALLSRLVRLVPGKRPAGRPGQRLARALPECGPSFIKLGQALSTRSDLLGEEMAADMAELRDRLAPFPGSEARAAIEAEFGRPVDDLFETFEDEAIAAASIAQVHFARTRAGRDVAVKILRPGVEEAFQRDLDLFFWIAELIEKLRPELRRLKPVQAVATLAETVKMEMDLRFEAAAAAELAENFKDDADFSVPRVDWLLTGRRVLVTERISGIPIDDRKAILAAGLDPEKVLALAAKALFIQVFRDGFFHADLHPGNLFARPDGGVAAVDFGIMGRLDRNTRRHLGELLISFLNRDYRRAAEIHFDIGWVPADQSLDSFTQACRSIGEPILDKPQNEISIARLLGQLFQVTETFQMQAQPQLLLLQKTLLVAEGTGRVLAPEANMWFLARPLIEGWVERALSPEARLLMAAEDALTTLKRLPLIVENLEKAAARMVMEADPEERKASRYAKSVAPKPLPVWLAGLLAAGAGFLAALIFH